MIKSYNIKHLYTLKERFKDIHFNTNTGNIKPKYRAGIKIDDKVCLIYSNSLEIFELLDKLIKYSTKLNNK